MSLLRAPRELVLDVWSKAIHHQGVRKACLADLPGDIILEVASYLQDTGCIDLALTCSGIFNQIVPKLYESVNLHNQEQALSTLAMLSSNPHIARHVLVLNVMLTNHGAPNDQKACFAISSAVTKAARFLDALHTFSWDAEEAPGFDDMWFALRISCPRLKHISTTVGSWTLNIQSHLLDFRGLKSFRLCLKPGFYIDHVGFPAHEELGASPGLWKMLIENCPQLEELSIEGSYAISADVQPLVRGRWPRLRCLTLGDVTVDLRVQETAVKRPFIEFLELHPQLEHLAISKHAISHVHMTGISPESLPNLNSFSGSIEQLQEIQGFHTQLKSLTFSEPITMRDITPVTLAGLLQSLPSLRELKLAFAPGTVHHSSTLMRAITSSCPQVRHFELTCPHRPSFQLESFAKSIRGFPRLRSFTLNYVPLVGEESLSTTAADIARSNPRLESFRIRCLRNELPNVHAFFPWSNLSQTGDYHVNVDSHGLPLQISAREKRTWLWGYHQSVKRYTSDLRPGHSKHARLPLIFEKSPAGDEIRLLLFLITLLLVSVWGFIEAVVEFGPTRTLSRALFDVTTNVVASAAPSFRIAFFKSIVLYMILDFPPSQHLFFILITSMYD